MPGYRSKNNEKTRKKLKQKPENKKTDKQKQNNNAS